ncbi:MAG: hypothetical protein ACRCZ9_02595 [Fusobacteriaceae bacterium]
MAGIKGMKTGGFSTGRPLSKNLKKNQIRVTDKEKELIKKIREKISLDEIFKLIKDLY